MSLTFIDFTCLQEHLFIVCELLRANLYEFHKYNRESGGEVYFTMPRLQVLLMFQIILWKYSYFLLLGSCSYIRNTLLPI